MNCTDSREQLALRLYDELDEHEAADLERHLEGCAACRALAGELGQGLGRLAASTPDDLPVGWADQLRGRVAEEPRPRVARSNPAAGLAAGFGIAAGFLLGLAVAGLLIPRFSRSAPDQNQADPVTLIRWRADPRGAGPDPRRAEFRRSSPPPLALAGGDLDRLQTYLSR